MLQKRTSTAAAHLKRNPTPGMRPGPTYAKPFIDVALLMGIPGGLTLGVLAVTRRRRARPTAD